MLSSNVPDVPDDDAEGRVWLKILGASMSIPGARVDRDSFLRSQLLSYCPEHHVDEAVNGNPASASVPPETIDRLADAVIKGHVVRATGISFAAGLPGGWFMAATIPGDVAQYFWHAIVLAEKLAYLYGWPDLLRNGEIDEETKWHITLLIGSMMGTASANMALAGISQRFAGEVGKQLPKRALTKTMYYPIVKMVGKWIGIKVTKQSFARVVSKAVPLLGGAVSAGVTMFTLRPMAKRLQRHLQCLEYNQPPTTEE